MKVISLNNEKGGVGKTTSATTLSSGLAIAGYRVLLIDGDPQGHATKSLGLEKEKCFYELVVNNADFGSVVYDVPKENYMTQDHTDNGGVLYIIPGNRDSKDIPADNPDTLAIIKRLVQIREIVDFVIFDTSPTPSNLHASIYMATDGLIYPTQLEPLSIDGLIESIDTRENHNGVRAQYGLPPTELYAVIPNMTQLNVLLHNQQFKNLQSALGKHKVWRPIHRRIAWAEAQAMQKSIFAYAPHSPAANDAWRLVEQFEGALQHV